MNLTQVSLALAVLSIVVGASAIGYSFSALSGVSSQLQTDVTAVRSDLKIVSDKAKTLSSDLDSVKKTTESITAEGKAIRDLVEKRLGGISVALEEANKKLAEAEQARKVESERVRILEKELARTKMIDAARVEGKVVVYTTMALEIVEALNSGFTKRYGIQVEYFRAAPDALVKKVEAEITGGASTADIVDNTGEGMDYFLKKGWVEPYRSPEVDAIPKDYWLDKDGYYPWNRVLPFVIAINTKVIKPEDAPKNYMDLLNPKYKGMIGLADPYASLTVAIMNGLKKVHGADWTRWIKGMFVDQEPRIYISWTPVSKAVAVGEVGIGFAVLPPLKVEIDKGAPVKVLPFENTPVTPQFNTIIKGAKHPNAAKLYFDFFLSEEGQTIMSKLGQTPVRPRIVGTLQVLGLDKIKLLDAGFLTAGKQLDDATAEMKRIIGR